MKIKDLINTSKVIFYIALVCLLSSCATASKSSKNLPNKSSEEVVITNSEEGKESVVQEPIEQPDQSPELQNISGMEMEEDPVEEGPKKGVVFGKTDFLGVLKTRFVKLLLENQEDPSLKFQLHIGDHKSDQVQFPWDVKTVQPGYFYIELPEGKYKITSITIPVGSSMATEEIDIDFVVTPEAISYVGTLQVVGTKERIKLGGVPVIQPGFEYTANVFEERKLAEANFRENYPNISNEILVNIMTLNMK